MGARNEAQKRENEQHGSSEVVDDDDVEAAACEHNIARVVPETHKHARPHVVYAYMKKWIGWGEEEKR